MEEQSHSFPLAHSLTPVVNFQNVKRTYLGLPYTPCTETFSTNNYTEVLILEQRRHQERIDEKPYKESICVFKALINKIIRNCNCYLDYIDGIQNYLPDQHQLLPCNFLVHATCVSQLVDSFGFSKFYSGLSYSLVGAQIGNFTFWYEGEVHHLRSDQCIETMWLGN